MLTSGTPRLDLRTGGHDGQAWESLSWGIRVLPIDIIYRTIDGARARLVVHHYPASTFSHASPPPLNSGAAIANFTRSLYSLAGRQQTLLKYDWLFTHDS